MTNDTLMRVRTLVSAEADCLQRIRLAFLAQKRKNAARAPREHPKEITHVFRCNGLPNGAVVAWGPDVLSGPEFHSPNQRRLGTVAEQSGQLLTMGDAFAERR